MAVWWWPVRTESQHSSWGWHPTVGRGGGVGRGEDGEGMRGEGEWGGDERGGGMGRG